MSFLRRFASGGRISFFVVAASSIVLCAAGAKNAAAQYSQDSEASTSDADWIAVYGGADFAPRSRFYYAGALMSLQGDFGKDGLVLRTYGGIGDFEYFTVLPPSIATITEIDADSVNVDLLLGYQFTRDLMTATIYVGVDYLDYDYTPDDPTNEIRGDEFGFKVALDAQTGDEVPVFASFSGAYSTAFDTYYAALRLGYNAKHFVVGPEGLLGGDRSSDVQRLGGFVILRFNITPEHSAELTGYGGYQFADEENNGSPAGGEGGYGGFSMSVSF